MHNIYCAIWYNFLATSLNATYIWLIMMLQNMTALADVADLMAVDDISVTYSVDECFYAPQYDTTWILAKIGMSCDVDTNENQ